MSEQDTDHVTRAELRGAVRELRLTIVVAVFAADAIVNYGSPLMAGAVAGAAALIGAAPKIAALLFH